MEIELDQITQIAAMTWEAILGMTIESGGIAGAPAPARSIAACVHITGAWDGAVLLDCSVEVARHAASVMFSAREEDVSVCDEQDSVAELVNIIGGNLKALLPEKCFLSLPAVVEGADFSSRIPGSRLLLRVPFSCQGHNVTVTLREREKPVATAA